MLCWQILEVGGSLLDTISIGVRAALQSTLLPRLTVTGEGEESEIQVSDNPHDSVPVSAQGAPLLITLHQVRGGGACRSCDNASRLQIGGEYVVDCGVEEELCSSCHLTFALNTDGHLLSSNLEGVASICHAHLTTLTQVYRPAGLVAVMSAYCVIVLQTAMEVAEELFTSLDTEQHQETTTADSKPPIFT